MTNERERFLDAFEAATGLERPSAAYAFTDDPTLADELATLAAAGIKRATSALLADHRAAGEPLPQPGDVAVVLDGSGTPTCVLRTTRVDVRRLAEVDAAFARDEGEGDRSLTWWRREHERFFARRCTDLGIEFSADLEVVCERFEKLWPTVTTPG